MKQTFELENIEYGKKYLEHKNSDGTTQYIDGNSYVLDNLKFSKDVYSSDEMVDVTDKFKKIVENTVNGFINTFESRGMEATEEQIYFARETANVIFGELKETIIPVIPAPCGYGKSTIKLEIVKELIKLYKNEGKNITNGIIIVGDRLDDLRDLEKSLVDCNMNGYTYMLESWNENICINRKVKESKPKICYGCDYFNKCKIGEQQEKQKEYPILLITNARLKEFGSSIDTYKKYNSGERTLLLIDERPEMLDTVKVNKALLNKIDTHMNSLNYITHEDKTEFTRYWKEISNEIENKMLSLRGKKRFILSNKANIGVCKDNKRFMEMWKIYMKNDYKRELNHIHTVITKGGFYVYEQDVEFISTIGVRDLINDYCTNFKTIIFDGSALYDPLYLSLYNSDNNISKIRYLHIPNTRTYENLDIKVNRKHKITKGTLGDSKYLCYGLSQYINNQSKLGFGYNYIVTYKEFANRIGDNIGGTLKSKVIKMDDGSTYYFGNTKGSNKMSSCNKMIQLGWDIMPDYEYAIQFLCSLGTWDEVLNMCENNEDAIKLSEYFEKKDRSIQEIDGKVFKSENKDYSFGLAKLNEFVWFDIVSKFYQEIHRTKLRQYDSNEDIEVILFQNRNIVFELIKRLFPKCKISFNDNELAEIIEAKARSFEKADGTKTDKQKILDWFDNWNGEIFKVKNFREEVDMTSKRWERLKKETSIINKINGCTSPKSGYYERKAV
ncbi:hypothetical protein KPL39_02030 [Clostridium gasigenes]|uniref:hypothetical protein n=1 Tax=Clostridium gasigenes TaxID=94869 RepID=UPI001C0AF628|nr:hypothetical protein [Clostridium gasigenes]MBU3135039.1 hypothetical protein [Clostridium gasigenes]